MNKLLLMAAMLMTLCSCSREDDFVGKSYQLQNAQNNVKVLLEFAKDEPRYSGAVVNRYFGNYEVDGNKIQFNAGGTTMMMGSPEEMEAEQNYLAILPRVVSYKMIDGNLVLITDNGQELGFKEVLQPTAD